MSIFSKLTPGRREKPEAAGRVAQEAFWAWFQDNTAFIETYAEDAPTVVAAIGERLRAVNPRVTFEMGRADDGIFEFIVSADGIRDVFPDVVALTKAAPTVAGWRIIAFRPRRLDCLEQMLRFGDMQLSVSALWYRSSSHEDKIDLTLCVEGRDKDAAEAMLGAVFILLDAVLGEYDVATKIGSIEFEDCPIEPAAAGLCPLSELANEVDARFAPARA